MTRENRALRGALSILLLFLLIMLPLRSDSMARAPQQEAPSLAKLITLPYLDLFDISPGVHFTPEEFEQMRKSLEDGQKMCVAAFKDEEKEYDKEIKAAQDDLKKSSADLEEPERHEMHCKIQNLQAQKAEAVVLAHTAIPTAYDNRKAKLDLIEKWPAERLEIQKELEDGSYRNRQWSDVEDIGFRSIAEGQQDDVKTGADAVEQMKRTGLLPRPLDNDVVIDYVTALAKRVGAHSDLEVPLTVSVLNSKEVNAFALPGGFVFVERGLLEKVDDESELAGVLAHEIGHVTARHAHKLMRRATIEQILMQAGEVAAAVLTGGAGGIGTYYALQYGFYGVGLVLDLNLLGVSRDFELQADQLGIQYTWNSGYDPDGFIRFFDKMATEEGYAEGTSFFRDHPPFYERMVDARREISFLPPQRETVPPDQAGFQKMKEALETITADSDEEDADRPRLRAPEPGCTAPATIGYEPGQPIEKICATEDTSSDR